MPEHAPTRRRPQVPFNRGVGVFGLPTPNALIPGLAPARPTQPPGPAPQAMLGQPSSSQNYSDISPLPTESFAGKKPTNLSMFGPPSPRPLAQPSDSQNYSDTDQATAATHPNAAFRPAPSQSPDQLSAIRNLQAMGRQVGPGASQAGAAIHGALQYSGRSPDPRLSGLTPGQENETGAANQLMSPFAGMGAKGQFATGPSLGAPQMSQGDAWSEYMRTGRNPLLGPNAPYGVFTPGGTADLMSRGSPDRQPSPPVVPNGDLSRAVQPQNRGLANGLQDMYNLNNQQSGRGDIAPYVPSAADVEKHRTQWTGGAYGQPIPNVPGQGSYDLDVGLAQNRVGRFREGMLADMNGVGKNMPVRPPEYQFGPQKGPDASKYEKSKDGMSIQPKGYGSAGYAKPTQAVAAEKMLASPERKAYLDARAAQKAARMVEVNAREKQKGKDRSARVAEARQALNPTFEQRLDAANPAAAQGRRIAAENAKAAKAALDLQLTEGKAKRDHELALGAQKIAGDKDLATIGPDGKPAAPAAKAPPIVIPKSGGIAGPGKPDAAGAPGGITLSPEQSHTIRSQAATDPDGAYAALIAAGATPDQANEQVRAITGNNA